MLDEFVHHTMNPNFRMADTSLDDGWSIIYDQIIGVESIYGIGLGPLSPWETVFAPAVSPCFHHTNMHASAIFPPSIKASIY